MVDRGFFLFLYERGLGGDIEAILHLDLANEVLGDGPLKGLTAGLRLVSRVLRESFRT